MDSFENILKRIRGNIPDDAEVFRYRWQYLSHLNRIWEVPEDMTEAGPVISPPPELKDVDDGIRFSRSAPDPLDWKLAFTGGFTRAIASLDRSFQGRILLALAELSVAPEVAKGDTIKPLVGEQRGLWRYRVGDYRLVYRPDVQGRVVVLLDFASRGSVYD